MEGREYSVNASGCRRFEVFFTDSKMREFKRVVWAPTPEHAVAFAMVADRKAGGENDISFKYTKETT